MTELEPTLRRLVRLCPEIVLEKREIELIADGKVNQVITEYKQENQVLDQTTEPVPRTDIPDNEAHDIDCSGDCCVEPAEGISLNVEPKEG